MNKVICMPFSVYTAWRGQDWSSIPGVAVAGRHHA